MKILRRYLIREILLATALVMGALLLLFAFFDLVEQIKDLGRGNYQMRHMVRHVLLSLPGHVYQIFPIAVLIGTLFALAQLVASSEYTVMRTAGVSVTRIVGVLMAAGLILATLTVLFGEYIGPACDQLAQRLRSRAITGIVVQEFRSGVWLKDDKSFVNVREVTEDGQLRGVRIYEFDGDLRLRSVSAARSGEYQGERRWVLKDVSRTSLTEVRAEVSRSSSEDWQTVLEPRLLNVFMVKPAQMSATSLLSYSQHLRENRQKSLRYEIALWTKITYPIAVLTMMVLALPFALFQRRRGGVGGRIFSGIMLGLSFYLLNQLSSHLGLLNEWATATGGTGSHRDFPVPCADHVVAARAPLSHFNWITRVPATRSCKNCRSRSSSAPHKAQSHGGNANQRRRIATDCAGQCDRGAIAGDELQAPGFHRQCLAGPRPLPNVEGTAQQQQPDLQKCARGIVVPARWTT